MSFYTRPAFAQLYRHKGFSGAPSDFTVIRRALPYGFARDENGEFILDDEGKHKPNIIPVGGELPGDIPIHRLRAFYNNNKINPKFLEEMLTKRREVQNKALAMDSVGSVTITISTGKVLDVSSDSADEIAARPVSVSMSDLAIVKGEGDGNGDGDNAIPVTDEEMEEYPGVDIAVAPVEDDDETVMPVLAGAVSVKPVQSQPQPQRQQQPQNGNSKRNKRNR
jgi:hypothetical protein